jgi:hypothetical protein
MGGVRQYCEGVSRALGLDGVITLDVKIMTERILQNMNQDWNEKEVYALESARIARDFRKLRDDIEWDKTKAYLCNQGVG